MRDRPLSLVGVIALLLVACQSDGITRPQGPEGLYDLETVNGVTLPFLKGQSATERIDVVSGSLVLRANGTYDGEIVERRISGGTTDVSSEFSSGTFAAAADRLTFTETASGAEYYGTVTGSRLSATLADVTFGFVRK